jgi:hypothetical protein
MDTDASRCRTNNVVYNICNLIGQHSAVGIAESCNISTCLHGNADYLKGICTVCTVAIEEVLSIKEDALTLCAKMGD